ncbi:MAG: ABC transporter permease [Acidobacteriaceae bacterium]|nr:ABC transporter permease [Acidobacteriaceae bacterium]MBV9297016.1 ABC transporter permease [Acidobacteriaceae bacterium]MBV9767881.1 ABC transporter permease [Acidobacteriaceae bacterium]
MSRLRIAFLTPTAAVMGLLFFAPLLIVFAYSFLTRGAYGGVMRPWTLEAYDRVFDPLYGHILWRSLWIAAVSTFLCLALGLPLALYIARSASYKTLLLNLVMLPFWTSFLIRTYAWMFLLRDTGLINTALESLHLIRAPFPLLFNSGAVILGLVYGYLPFMVLPLYATLEKLDPSLLDAAADLGASPGISLWRVIIPLSKSGMIAGCLLVFIPCLGAFLTPDLMGGGKTVMIGNLVQNQFTTARDWPFGAAISLWLMVLVLFVTAFLGRKGEELI